MKDSRVHSPEYSRRQISERFARIDPWGREINRPQSRLSLAAGA